MRSRWEKTARSPGAAGAGGRRRRRPAGPLCTSRARACAKAVRSWVSLGLGSKRFSRRAMTSTSVSLAWSLPHSTNLSPVEVMAGRSFSPAQVRERASARRGPLRVTAPVGAARTGSARKSIAEGSDERPGSTGERRVRAPGLPKYLSTILDSSDQTAMADSGYPARPGRLDGRLRGGGVRRARLQLHRQGQAVRALRPPSSANIHRFHASRSDLPVPHPSS